MLLRSSLFHIFLMGDTVHRGLVVTCFGTNLSEDTLCFSHPISFITLNYDVEFSGCEKLFFFFIAAYL